MLPCAFLRRAKPLTLKLGAFWCNGHITAKNFADAGFFLALFLTGCVRATRTACLPAFFPNTLGLGAGTLTDFAVDVVTDLLFFIETKIFWSIWDPLTKETIHYYWRYPCSRLALSLHVSRI
jgi:hypothetical protein